MAIALLVSVFWPFVSVFSAGGAPSPKARNARGVVLDEQGVPITGATVRAYHYLEWMPDAPQLYFERTPVFETETDARGYFSFSEINVGSIGLLVGTAPGYAPDTMPIIGSRREALIHLKLPAPATLDLQLLPCRWSSVVLGDVPEVYRRIELDSECQATVSGLNPGPAVLFPLSAEGAFVGAGHWFKLSSNETKRARIQLPGLSISGIVVGSQSPLSAAIVEACPMVESKWDSQCAYAVTSEDGLFEIQELFKGRWQLRVEIGDSEAIQELELNPSEEALVRLVIE